MVLSALTLASCLSALPLLAVFLPQQTSPATPDAIFAAVRTGDLVSLRRLIEAGTDVNARDPMGSTPLLNAAWSGNLEVLDFFYSHTART